MTAVAQQALALWGMAAASCRLVAARENAVFQVAKDDKTFALRLHRVGYRSDAELRSELLWMAEVGRGGISVPAPILSIAGDLLHVIDGVQVDVLTWLHGHPMGKTGQTLVADDRTGMFFAIGQQMARLHKISDAWHRPAEFTRCAWNRDGLLGATPLWGRFWDNPALSPLDKQLFTDVRKTANAELSRIEAGLDYGLIHSDLVRENILLDGGRVQLIDFDDGGFGFRVFDLATTLMKNLEEPDYPALRHALIDGYASVRAIDLGALDLFILLRAASYLGWAIARMHEAETKARNARFISTARKLALAYLAK